MSKALIENELILAIDFDGTITTEPDIGKELVLRDNCFDVLTKMHEDGIKLILWTCRSGSHLSEAVEFLDDKGLLHIFDAVNDQIAEVIEKYTPEIARKVGADVYFDDKNAMAGKIDWLAFQEFIYGEGTKDVG